MMGLDVNLRDHCLSPSHGSCENSGLRWQAVYGHLGPLMFYLFKDKFKYDCEVKYHTNIRLEITYVNLIF